MGIAAADNHSRPLVDPGVDDAPFRVVREVMGQDQGIRGCRCGASQPCLATGRSDSAPAFEWQAVSHLPHHLAYPHHLLVRVSEIRTPLLERDKARRGFTMRAARQGLMKGTLPLAQFEERWRCEPSGRQGLQRPGPLLVDGVTRKHPHEHVSGLRSGNVAGGVADAFTVSCEHRQDMRMQYSISRRGTLVRLCAHPRTAADAWATCGRRVWPAPAPGRTIELAMAPTESTARRRQTNMSRYTEIPQVRAQEARRHELLAEAHLQRTARQTSPHTPIRFKVSSLRNTIVTAVARLIPQRPLLSRTIVSGVTPTTPHAHTR